MSAICLPSCEAWGAGQTDRSSAVGIDPPKDARVFIAVLCVLLCGYAFMGRGFAYLGIKPLYVGELTLMIGLATVATKARVWNVLASPLAVGVLVLIGWGVCRSVPFLSAYGIHVLRDSVSWAYAVFALLVGGTLIAWPGFLQVILSRYLRFAAVFPLAMVVLWPAQRAFWAMLPRWPQAFGGGQPLFMNKPGDIYAHLAGICAFLLAGCFGKISLWSRAAIAGTAVLAASGRGGMLAFAASTSMTMLWRRPTRGVEKAVLVCGLVYVLLLGTGLSINFPGMGRDISARDITLQMVSIFNSHEDASLDATKQWRIRWWEKITHGAFAGQNFWGRGYGINLAEADGFEDHGTHSGVRSPHSIHMTMLARGGVVGALIWAGLNMLYAGSLITGLLKAKRRGQVAWVGLFSWLLAYWAAMLINGSFDVFIEGPMGGIWFWSLVGVGIAGCHLYRTHPGVLDGFSLNKSS